jgi:uncharacterized protein (TIRG00374 family)
MVVLGGRLPDPGDVIAVAGTADLRWAAVAVLAEVVSLSMFANQQRQLLSAFAVAISRVSALAITYSRSAISMVLPAGSAVSAAFAFQQFRQRGASRATAATVIILSGVASTAGLVLLSATGLLTATADSLTDVWRHHAVVVAGSAVLVVAVAVLTTRSITHLTRRPRAASAPRTNPRWPAVNRAVRQVASTARDARAVPVRQWIGAIAFSATNWLLDLVCLIAVAQACDLSIGYGELAGIYLAVQVVRQVPVTPGGIDLIETSLLAGLVAAGAAQSTAAAVVLGYRLISFWLILPVGLITYLGLRRPHVRPESRPAIY